MIRNDLKASKAKTKMTVLFCLLVLGTVGSFFPLYLNPQWIMISIGVISFFLFSAMVLADHHYFAMSLDGEHLKIRFYSVISFLRKPQMIDIPVESLKGYEIKKSNLGFKKTIVIKQRVKSQVASYPGVSISTLSRKEYNAVVSFLNRLAK